MNSNKTRTIFIFFFVKLDKRAAGGYNPNTDTPRKNASTNRITNRRRKRVGVTRIIATGVFFVRARRNARTIVKRSMTNETERSAKSCCPNKKGD